MNLNETHHLENRLIPPADECAIVRCQEARQLEDAGEYAEARKALGDLWSRIGEEPCVENLSAPVMAEVLLRVGRLSSWIGSDQSLPGAHSFAKDLISQAHEIFSGVGDCLKDSEALNALGVCYWRETEFDNARVHFRAAIERAGNDSVVESLTASVNLAMVERCDENFDLAYQILKPLALKIEISSSISLKARYHNEVALYWKSAGAIDNALVEYAVCAKHLEEAGHKRNLGHLKNNLGNLLLKAGRPRESIVHSDAAVTIFERLKDHFGLALSEEVRARVMIALGKEIEAERSARRSVHALRGINDSGTLIENLTTHAVTLSKLGKTAEALATFDKVINLAREHFGEKRASDIALIMVEELTVPLYEKAGVPFADSTKHLEETRLAHALKASNWKLKEAALRLGMSEDDLSYKLRIKYPKIGRLRPVVKTHRRSIIRPEKLQALTQDKEKKRSNVVNIGGRKKLT